ncbi:MAG: class I SAM-dependent methyltransferase [Acidimicrobiales bacterium]
MPKDKRAPGWLLDEVANAGRENLDPVHVQRYDQKEDAAAADELAVLTGFGLSGDSVVVDLGAGTGQFALAAARVCSRVVAVEVSPVMLEALMRRVDEEGVANIDVVASGFLTYEHEGPLADFAYSRYALHHLPDFWKAIALDRIRRLLRPGGVFRLWDVVYSFEPEASAERIEAWCATGASDADADWTRVELEEHVRDENSTYAWLLEPMIQRCGFRIEEAVYSEDGISARYVLRSI